MSIELTDDQAQVLSNEGEAAIVIDPRTRQQYRLVPEDTYRRIQSLYDGSPWTSDEMARLAAEAFGKLDDTDYSDYLRQTS